MGLYCTSYNINKISEIESQMPNMTSHTFVNGDYSSIKNRMLLLLEKNLYKYFDEFLVGQTKSLVSH